MAAPPRRPTRPLAPRKDIARFCHRQKKERRTSSIVRLTAVPNVVSLTSGWNVLFQPVLTMRMSPLRGRPCPSLFVRRCKTANRVCRAQPPAVKSLHSAPEMTRCPVGMPDAVGHPAYRRYTRPALALHQHASIRDPERAHAVPERHRGGDAPTHAGRILSCVSGVGALGMSGTDGRDCGGVCGAWRREGLGQSMLPYGKQCRPAALHDVWALLRL